MSETQTQSYTPADKTARKPISLWVWFVLLIFSVALLGAAIWWAGGLSEVEALIGSAHLSIPWFSRGSGQPSGPAKQSAPAASAPATSTLPAEAQQRMFVEQMESVVSLTAVVQRQMDSISFGDPSMTDATATIPVVATLNSGATTKGTLTLKRYGSAWYLFSLRRNGIADEAEPAPGKIDRGLVATLTQQQAMPGTQQLITSGLLKHGFRVVTIDHVQAGPRTATVDVTLSGGTDAPSQGRLVCISAVDGGTTYWFVARFEKR
jgi:hypothetical protein